MTYAIVGRAENNGIINYTFNYTDKARTVSTAYNRVILIYVFTPHISV